jgi:toxin ParE1/3/4
MRVIIRERAYDDLDRIYWWIAKDSPRNAQSVIDRILNAIEGHLAAFPFTGHAGKAPGTLEWVVRGLSYIVVYEVDAERELLIVTAIFHGAQDR